MVILLFSIGLSCLANANLDFRTARTQFNLNELRTTAQLQVQLIDDNEIEADEMFAGLLTLVNGERVTVDPDIAEFTIVDDESKNNNHAVCVHGCDIYNDEANYILDLYIYTSHEAIFYPLSYPKVVGVLLAPTLSSWPLECRRV